MEQIVEVSPDGTIQLPLEVLEQIKPQSRFVIATHNGTLVLKPADGTQFFWETASTEEWIADFRRWVASHTNGPNLPAEALRRESIYEDD